NFGSAVALRGGVALVGAPLDDSELFGTDFGSAWAFGLTGRACGCAADFNNDARLNPDDLSDYIVAYFSPPQPASADFNLDGLVNPDDLSDYVNAFFGGCD